MILAGTDYSFTTKASPLGVTESSGLLGIQYADKLGFEAVAISSGAEKTGVAVRLGARGYIDSSHSDPAVNYESSEALR
jgi:D-arabinose 1-dehydrogenase-like Zn-dependent alcohol dehydrogenase